MDPSQMPPIPMGPPGVPPPDPSMMGGPPMPPPLAPDPAGMQPPALMPPAAPPSPQDVAEHVLQQFANMEPEQLIAFMAKLNSHDQIKLLELAEAVPEIHDLLLAAMPIPKDYYPERPKWFKLPSKPTPETVRELAKADYDYYRPLRERFSDDLKHVFNDVNGTFKQDLDRKDIERATSVALANEINLGVALIGSIRPSYQVPMRSPDLADETQCAEDWLYWLDDQTERRYARRGYGVYWRDVAYYMGLYGRVITRRLLDIDDCDDPYDELLLDPATCCPIEGGKHGLSRITRRYQDSIVNLSRDFDVTMDSIRNPDGRGPDGQKWDELKPSQRVNVIEFWDEGWSCVLLEDGRVVKPVQEHHLGEVPFVYQLGGTGLPNGATDPDLSMSGLMPTSNLQAGVDVTRHGVSRIHWMKVLNDQREAVLTQFNEAILKSGDPPIWMGVDTMAKTRARSQLGTRKGRVYSYELGHEKPDVPNFAPMPPVVGPWLDWMGQEWSTAAMPMVAYGVNGAANVSGSAIEGLSEAGRDKLTGDLQALKSFYERRAEQAMRFWKDWGRLIQDAEGRYGVMTIPVLKPKTHSRAPTFELTPEMIRKTGATVIASMTSLRMQNLGALGAAVGTWTGLGAMSKREAMELRGARNPDEVLSEIDYEKAIDDDTLRNLRILAALNARSGDPLSPDELAKMQSDLFLQKVQKELAAGNQPPPSAQPPGQMPPGPPMPSVSGGVNMGDYGSPPGVNGGQIGRPPGPPGSMPPPGSVQVQG